MTKYVHRQQFYSLVSDLEEAVSLCARTGKGNVDPVHEKAAEVKYRAAKAAIGVAIDAIIDRLYASAPKRGRAKVSPEQHPNHGKM